MRDLHDAVRIYIYSYVASEGTPPSAERIAGEFDIAPSRAFDVLRALGAERKVILSPSTGEIWMCGPFSGVPTRFRVHGDYASWHANCAWDMLGIPASLGAGARVETSCACCDEPASIRVHPDVGPVRGQGVVHIMLPARSWYNDIGFT